MAEISKIQKIEIKKLKPYEKNAKIHSEKQIEKLVESIKEFGFISPVLIDRNLNVVAGHGRIMAAEKAGIEKLPCVFIEGLTESQRKAYILADNRLAEFGSWDMDLVQAELSDLDGIDLDFDIESFEFPDIELDDGGGYYGDERERTNRAYNLDKMQDVALTSGFWQMPVIKCDDFVPDRLIGFNYAKTSKDNSAGIHFFVDDYQFERVWNYPEKYTDILSKFSCILSPDFSLYREMPMPMKIWNVYRSRQIGAYYQSLGIKVIPTISWCEKETYQFCFEGIPKKSIVAVSTVGVKENDVAMRIYKDGIKAMLKAIEPTIIIQYGGDVGVDMGGVDVIDFQNEVTEKWHDRV